MQILRVEEKYNNKKLSTYLLDIFPLFKKSTLFKALRKKDIRVNNVRVSDDTEVHTGDEIKVFIADKFLFTPNKTYSNTILDIVFEDDNIILLNKPTGVEVTGDNSLTTQCEKHVGNFVKPCHRLDRNTSRTCTYGKK